MEVAPDPLGRGEQARRSGSRLGTHDSRNVCSRSRTHLPGITARRREQTKHNMAFLSPNIDQRGRLWRALGGVAFLGGAASIAPLSGLAAGACAATAAF